MAAKKKAKKEETVEKTVEERFENKVEETIEEVSKAESLKPFSELTTITLRQEWEKRRLIEFVEKTYEGCEVKVETLNPRQICFHIDGVKVPEEGYFSVK